MALAVVLGGFSIMFFPQGASANLGTTLLGFRASEGGGGKLDLGWTGGQLGNTWTEGEWVPYQLQIYNVQDDYPNLDGIEIIVSYDFTRTQKNYPRFIDLVRDLQVTNSTVDGAADLTDMQGWPRDDGTAYPMTTRQEIEEAQNDIGNTDPLENTWPGFTLLNLPNNQVNRALDGSLGTLTDQLRTFKITKFDLVTAGIPVSADYIVIYWQLHESRTFIWDNGLQAGYADPPTDAWGGYVYGNPPFDGDTRQGSGYVPGASGHVQLETLGGSQDVPIPIPETLPGEVTGMKWHDTDGDGLYENPPEYPLEGWKIWVSGEVEGIHFETSNVTDVNGLYSFPSLTVGDWTISEDSERFDPTTTGWEETYPFIGAPPIGVAVPVAIAESGRALVGWNVSLSFVTGTSTASSQSGVDFGNRQTGCLNVTKVVELGDVVNSGAISETFEICITGPSYPNGDEPGACQNISIAGGTLTWGNLTPGDYTVTETDPGTEWSVTGGGAVTVNPGETCNTSTVTNTYVPGCLEVVKEVGLDDYVGAPEDIPDTSFNVNVSGPSYPSGHILTFNLTNGTLTSADRPTRAATSSPLTLPTEL